MQITAFKNQLLKTFLQAGLENAQQEINWIFAKFAGLSAIDFFINSDLILKNEQIQAINQAVQRRIAGEPLAYILQSSEFYGLDFFVNSSVLIPRQDTEALIDFILNDQHINQLEKSMALSSAALNKSEKTQTNSNKANLKLLDLCTGSGIIGLTLKKHCPDWQILLSDISEQALEVAKQNAQTLQAQVEIVQSDLFLQIPKSTKFEIIVSNPPYIAKDDHHLENLKYEPLLALVAEDSGLEILKKIIFASKDYLTDKGILILEHGYDQGEQVRDFLQKADFSKIATKTDLGKNDRFSFGIFQQF